MIPRNAFGLASLCLLIGSTAAFSQEDPAASQREAMKKLAFWIGEWKGTGTFSLPNGVKRETTISESIQPRLNGLTLLVEGLGKTRNETTMEDMVTHNALAVVSFDPKTRTYRMRHYTADGRSGDAELKLIDGGMEWGFHDETRGTTVRFTTKFDARKWHEIGEASRDGKTWFKFLEMSLEKQK